MLRGAGVPESVVSDCRPQFTAKFWVAFCYHLRIGRRLSTLYHPQTDRQMERQNQTLEQYLCTYDNYQQDDSVSWLPLAEFAYNNNHHASTSVMPFYAERMVYPNIEEAVRKIPADRSVPDVPDAKARAEQIVELRAFLEKRWRRPSRSTPIDVRSCVSLLSVIWSGYCQRLVGRYTTGTRGWCSQRGLNLSGTVRRICGVSPSDSRHSAIK